MPISHSLSESKEVLTFGFSGLVTEAEIEEYHELRINYPKLERPIVVFIDACDVEEWNFELKLERMMRYSQRLADRYAGTGEIIAAVSAGATERFYGYISAVRTYVGEDYPVEIYPTREEGLASVQRYLDASSKK